MAHSPGAIEAVSGQNGRAFRESNPGHLDYAKVSFPSCFIPILEKLTSAYYIVMSFHQQLFF